MAGGRRNPARATPPKPLLLDHDSKRLCIEPHIRPGHLSEDGPPLMPITPPKHIPLPSIPRLSELAFETLMLLFGIIALGLQHLNIYRTVFWLPHSYTKYAMNLYLIDKSLVWFIVVMLSRRACWSIIKLAINNIFEQPLCSTVLAIGRIVFVVLLGMVLAICLYNLSESLTYIRILALGYPFVFYVVIFEMELTSFLEVLPVLTREDFKRGRQVISHGLQHTCLNSSEEVRMEIDAITKDCNKRMAQVMYQTIIIVYYTTFIPCIFVPSSLQYDVSWVMFHAFFITTTFFMWHLIYCFPASYCDNVHRSVLHLGGWSKIEGRATHVPFNIWSQSSLWPQGALVKHQRELYKAEGITNAAEPGNTTHARLFAIFNKPWRVLLVLVVLEVSCTVLHLGFLISLHQWQQVLATALVLMASYTALYHLLRDYMVLKRVYYQEQIIQEKANN